MAKTKPMSAAGEKKKSKGKKKGKNGPAKVAMKARGAAAEERNNPFEAIWSRRKFDVLGKKRKGEERRVSRSRSEAIRKVTAANLLSLAAFPLVDWWLIPLALLQRENTLLKEFVESAKSSVFHDRRIGERDDTLPEFDKAILRQQRERLVCCA
jgi:nucleolar protein 14